MKTGKYIPLGFHNNIRIGYGTVDYKNLKSIYLKLNSWVEPKNDEDDFELIVRRTRKNIINKIYYQKNPLFKKQCLVDLDIRTNGIKKNKRSFMNLELTLFVNEQFDIKTKESKDMVKQIISTIIEDCLTNKNLYNFHKTKIDGI
jgi:hypothetical protein